MSELREAARKFRAQWRPVAVVEHADEQRAVFDFAQHEVQSVELEFKGGDAVVGARREFIMQVHKGKAHAAPSRVVAQTCVDV